MRKRILSSISFNWFRNAAVAAVLAVITFMLNASARLQNASETSDQSPAQELAVSASPNAPGEPLEAELVTLRPTGFEPSEISRPLGEFLLVVNNQSGLAEINLRLARELGGTVREVRINAGRLRSGHFEMLPLGRYVLTEANHPGWICRIAIRPN